MRACFKGFVAAAALALAPTLALAATKPPRARHVPGPIRPGAHELKDPTRWPAEPPTPAEPIDAARFVPALADMCRAMVTERAARDVAEQTLAAARAEGVDPFLLGALVYRQSRCVASLTTPFGVGLTQIQPSMYASAPAPLPRSAFAPARLREPKHNLAVAAKLLALWQADHTTCGGQPRWPGGVAHRSAAAHFIWGDCVRTGGSEDRVLLARRRLLERYAGRPLVPRESPLGLPLVSPLEGVPRVATSGPGDDREGGARAHRGLDIDATVGEPVRAVADGTVSFAGLDMPTPARPQPVEPEALAGMSRAGLGPGGLFVCVRHQEGLFTCYFHLSAYEVRGGQRVTAGQVLGAVGRSGIKASASHLHFEVHRDGRIVDPAPVLAAFVIEPTATYAHDFNTATKKERLKRERRERRKERIAARAAAALSTPVGGSP